MDHQLIHKHPPRVIKILSAFVEIETRQNANIKTPLKAAATYAGLQSVLPGTSYMAVKLNVAECVKLGYVLQTNPGGSGGRGKKSMFALTPSGRAACKLAL